MQSEDIKKLSSLEIMRRTMALLPEGNPDRDSLRKVVAGLSTPDGFEMVNGEIVSQTDYIPKARALLKEVLPKLLQALPEEPLVQELCERYSE